MEGEYSEFIIERIEESPGGVRTFRLVPKDGKGLLRRIPGQYFSFKIGELERSYSLSGPSDAPYLEITVRLLGAFTTKLFSMKEGDILLGSGPKGRFVLSEEKAFGGKELVFLAGGVGITPFLSMLDSLSKSERRTGGVVLIYGSRKPSEIIMRDRAEKLVSGIPGARIVHTVDSPEPGWIGNVGFIGKEIISREIRNPKEALFFLCGPPIMVKSLVACLKELGVPVQNITLEGW